MERLAALNASGRGMELGLSRMRLLASAQGLLEAAPRVAHVAGTNGKGSCCFKVAHGLRQRGLRVGLFTKPHVVSYRERIVVDGRAISERDVGALVDELTLASDRVVAAAAGDERLRPTYFESLVLLALAHFRRQRVDVAVIEAGLGGLEDATNVIAAPTVCAITTVALDHTDVLGSSVESIARHKAGIFKAGCRAVVGPRARPAEQLRAAAEAAGCRSFTQVFCGAGASVDEENSLVAQAVLEALGEPTALEQLRGVRPVGRFERFRRRAVDVVLDGGHNPDALGRLRAELAAAYPGFRAHIVLAMSAGKDLGGALRCLLVGGSDRSAAAAALPGLPTASLHVAPSGNAARSAAAEDVCAAARAVLGQHPQHHEQHAQPQQQQQRESVPVHSHASLLEAFDAAEAEAAREERALILVCGSFNALGEVRHARLREHREGGGGGDHEDVLLDGVNMNENKLL